MRDFAFVLLIFSVVIAIKGSELDAIRLRRTPLTQLEGHSILPFNRHRRQSFGGTMIYDMDFSKFINTFKSLFSNKGGGRAKPNEVKASDQVAPIPPPAVIETPLNAGAPNSGVADTSGPAAIEPAADEVKVPNNLPPLNSGDQSNA
ncbi:uncharacterized protein LOC134223304 [Armigeres subalbatus]|uniref:uncharacterized protein LOC134223304 n=1 Tax=Armigeres subalbatus TaxID=124917 RepID=UPI002ED584D3